MSRVRRVDRAERTARWLRDLLGVCVALGVLVAAIVALRADAGSRALVSASNHVPPSAAPASELVDVAMERRTSQGGGRALAPAGGRLDRLGITGDAPRIGAGDTGAVREAMDLVAEWDGDVEDEEAAPVGWDVPGRASRGGRPRLDVRRSAADGAPPIPPT